MIRLNKFLASCGVASRRSCDTLILDGKVKVNGKIENGLGTVIDESKDKVEYDGKVLCLPVQKIYIKMNKPKGYLCTTNDEHGRHTVYELLDIKERLFTVGRLDYDTEGLLIFTNDGDLANKLAHPRSEIKKVYVAKAEGAFKESELAVMRAGVVINGEKLPSCKVERIECTKNLTKLRITLKEGQNHQIKKMFEGIGKNLVFLKRVQIGNVKLGGLSRGESKPLSTEELLGLKNL